MCQTGIAETAAHDRSVHRRAQGMPRSSTIRTPHCADSQTGLLIDIASQPFASPSHDVSMLPPEMSHAHLHFAIPHPTPQIARRFRDGFLQAFRATLLRQFSEDSCQYLVHGRAPAGLSSCKSVWSSASRSDIADLRKSKLGRCRCRAITIRSSPGLSLKSFSGLRCTCSSSPRMPTKMML